MGGTQSRNCKTTLQNPDMLNVVTLSDSAVQRLPLVVDSSLQEKEQRFVQIRSKAIDFISNSLIDRLIIVRPSNGGP